MGWVLEVFWGALWGQLVPGGIPFPRGSEMLALVLKRQLLESCGLYAIYAFLSKLTPSLVPAGPPLSLPLL